MAQTSLRSILRRSALLQRWRFLPYTAMYALARMLRRVHDDRVLFLSDSRAGFTGNFAFLRDEILRQEPDADVIGVFKPRLRARRPLADMVRLPWLMASAHTIVLDDLYPLIYPSRIRRGTRLVQVWHAAGAFKRVGYSRAGLPGGPAPGTIAHRNYTDATVSAESIRGDYAEAFDIPIERVRALGVARTDAFFDESTVAASAAAVRERYGIPDSSKIALFAPTFRGNGQLTATFDYDSVDWDGLGADLGDGWTVLVKMHPFVRSLRSARPGVTKVVDVTDDREITELMMAADVLVTDYSSAIFEFALLRRPIVFFCPDLEQYTADRDFYYPFAQYLTGPVVRRSDELAAAIAAATVDGATEQFLERFMGACDGHSSERIVRDVILRRPARHADVAPVAPGGSAPAPTRASSRMWLWLTAAALARFGLRVVYAPLKLLPVQRKVVMISREHPTVPADFADIADAVRRLDPTVRVTMLVKMMPPGIIPKIGYVFHMLRQLYHVATARVLVVDTYAIVASVPTHRRELTVVQIWHALGAFKKFGLSILDQDEGRDGRLAAAMRMHEGYDVVLTSAEECRPAYAEAFGTAIEKVVVAPLPRVDHLRDRDEADAVRDRIHAAHPHLRDARVAVFAPTFRLDGTVTVDPAELSRELAAIGLHTVVKLHPLMSADFGPDVDLAPGFSTQDLLHVADVLITDYSSVLYEAAVVGVPSYFLTPDLDDYLDSRDFYLDYRRDLPGPIVRDVAALARAVAAAEATAADAAAFAARWVQVPADAAERDACAMSIAQRLLAAVDSGAAA
ncbi:CDP-glycerol glycerophosphotransferase family protein [Microbacterium fluvii]|uniref:CDP-glycerol glycerophosphotransferase family protein n=1 Tax=Microbacterium fluvii TaxID=415215 RepID=A0ABW2H9N6_9MICO|nr:CDP-glycerol glycerophosphotransferase family protein [Microbacterium fluvii]MCU4671430.1 CDP-glycerol glycerophosphotransferase family protein [Microbacterium fluvii]